MFVWSPAIFLFVGCLPKAEDGAGNTGDVLTPEPEAFEGAGTWEYTGGLALLTNTMEISEDEILDFGDYDGTEWRISWRIDSKDNANDQAQLILEERQGFSHYEVGERLYMSWRVEGDSGHFSFSTDDYLEPGSGTEGQEYLIFTRQ